MHFLQASLLEEQTVSGEGRKMNLESQAGDF